MSDVQHWRDTIAALEGQMAAEKERESKLAEKRRKIALRALVGDGASQKLLGAYGRETVDIRTKLEDLGSAIAEAEVNLAEAKRAEEQVQEAGRMRVLAELAERQVVRAQAVEAAIAGAVKAITGMEELAREMAAIRPTDDAHYRRCDAAPVLGLTVQKHLGSHVGLSERSRDPRFGKPLEMLMRERLAPFLPEHEPAARAA
jgi:hypothetical protein